MNYKRHRRKVLFSLTGNGIVAVCPVSESNRKEGEALYKIENPLYVHISY
jgi:hypothetical protein